jgi:hypothetical protein
MPTILIAHRDSVFTDRLAADLRRDGYCVVTCPGPVPPANHCIRCQEGYCPLTQGADVMVYDPSLTASTPDGGRCNVALASARAHPDVPMLLAWTPGTAPDPGTLLSMAEQTPSLHVAAHSAPALLAQVRELLDAAPTRQREAGLS